ncbi:MAG: hypothetical protein KDA97_10875 [Acidimicrobiales bacterium]|nr:hypothetical protein [Acidimicrobiales bacterium]
MGLFKQMKDMKNVVAEAPGMVQQANEMAANAQQMAAQQQAAAAQQSAAAEAGTGPDFEPVNGLSLEIYAEIARTLNAEGTTDQNRARQLAEARGISGADWDAAVAEWTARMTRNHAVGKRFNSLYMGR